MENDNYREPTPEEIAEFEHYAQEEADFNFQMQKIDDAWWREAAKSLIANGIKPLATF